MSASLSTPFVETDPYHQVFDILRRHEYLDAKMQGDGTAKAEPLSWRREGNVAVCEISNRANAVTFIAGYLGYLGALEEQCDAAYLQRTCLATDENPQELRILPMTDEVNGPVIIKLPLILLNRDGLGEIDASQHKLPAAAASSDAGADAPKP